MTRQTRIVARFSVAALVLLLLAYAVGLFDRSDSSFLTRSPPDLTGHPVYSSYQFGNEDKILDIGTQPLFLPGVISEVMKRDAILKSVLAERGVEARFHPFLKGADVNFFLARGDLEAGIGGDMPTLMACANSAAVVTSLIDQHFAAMVARQPLLIPELKGKRVAYAYGSQAHYALLDALAAVGLEADDVRMIAMDVDSMPDALHDGSIDTFSAWEPIPTIAINKYPEFVPIQKTLTTGYLYFSRSFAVNSPELLRFVVASQLRAMAWITANGNNLQTASSWAVDAGAELGGDAGEVPAKLFAAAVKDGLLGISASAVILDSSMEEDSALFREFRFLRALGEVPDTTRWHDISSCFDRTLVPEITAQPERYELYVGGFLDDRPGSQ